MGSRPFSSTAKLLVGAALGLTALPLAFSVVASAMPRPAVHRAHEAVRAAARREAERYGWPLALTALRTQAVKRRPLIRMEAAVGSWLEQDPAGLRSPMPHTIWLEARTAGAGAERGAPVEVRAGGRKLIGVVVASHGERDGTRLWIALDRRMARGEKGVQPMAIELPLGAALSVPAKAVTEQGNQRWVWLETPTGVQHRQIALGPRAENFFVVDRGLDPGARVVTDRAFLETAEAVDRALTPDAGSNWVADKARSTPATRQAAGTDLARSAGPGTSSSGGAARTAIAGRPDPWGPLPD